MLIGKAPVSGKERAFRENIFSNGFWYRFWEIGFNFSSTLPYTIWGKVLKLIFGCKLLKTSLLFYLRPHEVSSKGTRT